MRFLTITSILKFATMTLYAAPAAAAQTTYNGIATYYYQEGAAGSCGQSHSDNDFIVAVSEQAPFTHNEYCGKTVTIKNTGSGINNNGVGKTITATVTDTCMGCDPQHLDLSTGAFEALTGGQLDPPGVVNIQWNFN